MLYINKKEKILGYSEAMELAKEKWGDRVIIVGNCRDLRQLIKLNTTEENRREVRKNYQVKLLSYIGETSYWYDKRTGKVIDLTDDWHDVGIQPYVYYDGTHYKEIFTEDWYVLLDRTKGDSVYKRLTKEELKEIMEKENYFPIIEK